MQDINLHDFDTMNLQQLEYVIALAEQQHFGRAAEACNVTQPTLSAMIQKLEEELGVKIFDRSRQPISTTEIGLHVISQAKETLRSAEQIKGVIDEARHSLKGCVRMGILPTISPYLVPRILAPLAKMLPELTVNVSDRQTSQCEALLEEGELDVCIMATDLTRDSFAEKILYYEEFIGYVAEKEDLYKQDNIKSSEVKADSLWLLAEGHCFRDQLVKFCHLQSGGRFPLNYREGSLEGFMRLVETGHGVTFLPELCAKTLHGNQLKLLRPFSIPRPTRAIRLVYRKDFVRKGLIEALCEVIRKAVPKEMLTARADQAVV